MASSNIMILMEKVEKIKLAVVDDAPFIREIVKQITLHAENLQLVAEAQNGVEALQMLEKVKPDVILMDMVMPQMNGVEASKQILEKYPDMKIIAFSTVDEDLMMLKALEAGCCNYLKKPFDAKSVIDVINKSLLGETL